MNKSAIGLIGLATMGANLARNIANKGFRVSVFNRTTEKTEKFVKHATKSQSEPKGEQNVSEANSNLIGTYTLQEFVAGLETPRKIILLIKAGQAVDDMTAELSPLLDKNDIIIDCGNSHFKDTERRQKELAKHDLNFIGCGISGGEEGALHGPSLMPGGKKEAWKKIRPIFEKIAAKDFAGKPCVTHIGDFGSGHFVKMVHNGIEYAIMQLLAESYDMLKNLGGFSNSELAKIFTGYNKNPNLKSFLIEITAKIFVKKDPEDHSKNPHFLIDLIKDAAGQKGTGKWTTEIAHDLGVYAPTINAAVDARIVSGDTKTREMSQRMLKIQTTAKRLTPADKKKLVKQVENALELATMICYEQGIGLISKADKEFHWNLNRSEIIRIWQGGCIIRSGYLKDLAIALGADQKTAMTMFTKIMQNLGGDKQKSWRKVILLAVESAIPVPAFYATLNYYDSYAEARLPQNLIQAQRDFFGAHGYERTDKPGSFHIKW
ncbi:NADP-dependent phosphogluconate dehydrogenase [Candidatus Peregrinibacteria bacterium]|nr:NADP-dependent phosphogluconate dehydrogenase [Candidatus Peregrinibacteria bacterium]